ncbi:ATP-binding protein, partial [Streptomyces massasporeus]
VLTEDSRIDDGLVPAALPSRDLVTILGNLIDNAVEAAGGTPHARVTVTVAARTGDGELLLRVADNGPGVRPADRDAVLGRGWTTRGPGRGLGLALVGQAVSRAAGTLEVTDAEGGGARFTVRLPLPAPTQVRAPLPLPLPLSLSREGAPDTTAPPGTATGPATPTGPGTAPGQDTATGPSRVPGPGTASAQDTPTGPGTATGPDTVPGPGRVAGPPSGAATGPGAPAGGSSEVVS